MQPGGTQAEKNELWEHLVEEFGRYEYEDPETGELIKCSFSSVTRLVELFKQIGKAEKWAMHFDNLKRQVGAKFQILVLSGLNGALCFRKNENLLPESGESINQQYVFLKHNHIWIRPGTEEFVRRIREHPRAIFGFYSSMKAENADMVSKAIVGLPEWEENPHVVFAAKYHSFLDEYPNLKHLVENHWDVIRDLNKIVTSEFCTRNNIGFNQVLLIENEVRKCQSCRENTIIFDEYTEEDVRGTASTSGGVLRDENWHLQYMQKYADMVL